MQQANVCWQCVQGHAVLCSKITDVHGIEVLWVRT